MSEHDSPTRALGGRLKRGARLARVGVRGAAGIASGKARSFVGADPAPSHDALAQRLAEVLGEMKGAAMKLGQLLSFVDLDLPPDVQAAYHDALAQLRDQAPAHDLSEIVGVIERDLGAPINKVFASFEEEPLAAASIGQVHAATLLTGEDIVIKVQYPGVADAVRADLANAESLTPLIRLISPNLEIGPLVDELRERVLDELDYEREAQYQDAFASRYADHPFIRIPAPMRGLCRNRVLVAERIYGRRFDDIVASDDQELRNRVGEIIFRYAFGSISRFRLFNGDPHPGNYLIQDDGTVAFLDYGSVKMFSQERIERMDALDEAVFAHDTDAFVAELRESGFTPGAMDIDAAHLLEWFHLFTRPVTADQPFTYTRAFASEVIASTTDPSSPWVDDLRKMNLPADYLLLNRIQWGINSLLASIEATGPWRAIHDELRHDAAPATDLGKLDRAWWEQAHR